MSNAAIQRNMEFNPQEYQHHAHRLAKERPELAANAMTQLARSKNAAEATVARSQNMTTSIVAGATAAAGMIGIGFWDGSNHERADAMVRDWEEGGAADVGADLEQYPTPWSHPEGVKDPTMYFGFAPKMLVSTIGLALVSAGISAATRKPLVDPATGQVVLDEHGDEVIDENYDNLFAKLFRDLAFLNFGFFAASWGSRKGRARAAKKIMAAGNGGVVPQAA